MANSLSIFDGALLRDLSDDEVALLDEADQEVLASVIVDCRAAEAQDTLVAETRKLLYQKMADHDAAVLLDQKANPPTTAVEAARMAIAANNPNMPRIEPRKPNKKSRQALAIAGSELAAIQADYTRALVKQKTLDRARGEAILRWIATHKTVDDLTLRRQAAANWVPNPVAVTVPQCEMDRAGRAAKSRQRTPASNKAFPGSGLPIIRDLYKAR